MYLLTIATLKITPKPSDLNLLSPSFCRSGTWEWLGSVSESSTRLLLRCQLRRQKSQGSTRERSACKLIHMVVEVAQYSLGCWPKGLISTFTPSYNHAELLAVIQFPKCTRISLRSRSWHILFSFSEISLVVKCMHSYRI